MKHAIPKSALEHHIAFVGKTGSGKTGSAKSGIIEPALAAEERVCVIDPTGAWWGLRLDADGKSRGLPIYVFGGDHGDYPLLGTQGEMMAEAIGSSNTPVILDTTKMKTSERMRFFTDFADTILRTNQGALRLVIDECHLFAPQAGTRGSGLMPDMLHAANNLISLGRSRGLRIVLISQRPAKVHKDSLTQVESLVAMRLIAPQDRKAVEEWIADQADKETGKEIIASLPSLKTGEAWVWSPEADFLKRVSFPLPITYDSSKVQGTGMAAKRLSPIDLEKLQAKFAKVKTEAEAKDPKILQKRVTELETKLRKAESEPGAPSVDKGAITAAEQRGFDRGFDEALARGVRAMGDLWSHLLKPISTAKSAFDEIEQIHEGLFNLVEGRSEGAPGLQGIPHESWTNITGKWPEIKKRLGARGEAIYGSGSPAVKQAAVEATTRAVPAASAVARKPSPAANGGGNFPPADGLTTPQRRVMTSLAFWKSMGHEAPTREQVAAVAGYRPGSGNFNNIIGGLSTMGQTAVPAPGRLSLNVDYEGLSPAQARDKLWSVLDNPQKRLVEAAKNSNGDLARDELAMNAGYAPGSGNFNNITGRLTSMDILQRAGTGRIALSDWARQVLS